MRERLDHPFIRRNHKLRLKCIVAIGGEREKRLPDKLQLYNFPHLLQRPMRYDTRLSPIAEA